MCAYALGRTDSMTARQSVELVETAGAFGGTDEKAFGESASAGPPDAAASSAQQENNAVVVAKAAVALLSAVRLLPHIALLLLSPGRALLVSDLSRYAEMYDDGRPPTGFHLIVFFVRMMTFVPEYRNVFYFRHRSAGHILALLCPPMKSLRLMATTCGPGLFVHHGFGTMVTAEAIGANFTIRQLATVGYANNATDCPKIGNNVTVGVGARVLGGVAVGDNVIVGANSVVIADVPPDLVVMGVPSKVVCQRPQRGA